MKNLRGLFAFVLVLSAVPCFAAVDAFLKIDGVKGESQDASHNGWIEISSFSWGATNPTGSMATHSNTNAQGCATGEIRFGARGAAVVPMQKLVLTGAHLQPVTLEVSGQRHVLEGAMLTSCQGVGHGNGDLVPAVNCVMRFQRCATHSNAVNTAAVLNRNAIQIAPNGQLLFGNDPAEALTVVSLRQQSPNSVVLSASGASQSLMRHCATGTHYPNVRIVCRKAGGTQQEFLTFTMHDVIITSYHTGGDGSASIEMKYAMADGSARSFQDLH